VRINSVHRHAEVTQINGRIPVLRVVSCNQSRARCFDLLRSAKDQQLITRLQLLICVRINDARFRSLNPYDAGTGDTANPELADAFARCWRVF
jgi:hypothetical protein